MAHDSSTPPLTAQPVSVSASSSSSRLPAWCVLAACAVILGIRRFDMIVNPQFWAEDGPIFFLGAHLHGPASLFEPYAGYFHTLLRLVALGASAVNPIFAPAVYSAASLLLTLYVAGLTLSSRFALTPSCGYAFALVLVPDAVEVILNLTNLQWILALGLVALLLFRDPSGLAGRVHDCIAAPLLSLTGPFSILLTPFFLVRAWQRRTAHSWTLVGIVVGCASIQLITIARADAVPAKTPLDLAALLSPIGARIGGSLFGGGAATSSSATNLGIALAFASIALIGFFAFRRGPDLPQRALLFLALGGLLAAALFRCRHVLAALNHNGCGGRYFFPIQALVLWLLVASALSPSRTHAQLARGLLLLALLVNLPRLHEPALPDARWADYAARIREGVTTTVRINPEWEFTVPGTPSAPPAPTAGLVNVSTRAFVTSDRPAIVGLTVLAGRPRTYLVRALGPSLRVLGATNACARPTLSIVKAGSEREPFSPPETREGLASALQLTAAFKSLDDPAERVSLIELSPGVYDFIVQVSDADQGEALLEVYELPETFSCSAKPPS